MDALLATFLAVLLAEQGDKFQLLAADTGRRFARPAPVAAGLIAAAFFNALLAGVAGMLVQAMVPFRALTLLLALALLSAGAGALLRAKPSAVVVYPRLGAFGGPAFAALVLGFGGGAQFLTFAIAARTGSALLAATGATLAGAATILPPLLLGARLERTLPTRALRLGAAGLLLLAGTLAGLTALRLI